MNFMEMLAELNQGKFCARDIWDNRGEYLAQMPGMPFIWRVATIPNPAAGSWMPFSEDFLATDWKSVDRVLPKTVLDDEEKACLELEENKAA